MTYRCFEDLLRGDVGASNF
jgi:hypothetical protein